VPTRAAVNAALSATDKDWESAGNPTTWEDGPAKDAAVCAMAATPMPKQLSLFWIKTAGLYPSGEEMDESLAKHNAHAASHYGEAAHALMQDLFESRLDEAKMKTAAEITGACDNVDAMIGVYYGFLHGLGMAYQKSGWADGRAAAIAIGTIRFDLAHAWDGINGFSASML